MWYGPDGRRLHYADTGAGEAVVLLPGWPGDAVDLDGVRRGLVGGFRTIAVDLPGGGRSEPQPRTYGPTYYEDDTVLLLGLLDELGLERAHLVGFSDGGEDALMMAALDPDRALSVVTWGAAGRVEGTPESFVAFGSMIDDPTPSLAAFAGYLVQAYGVDAARTMVRSEAAALSAIAAAGGSISADRAAGIRCPTLLITGSDDAFCPPELVRRLAEELPRGQFIEVPGAGHDVHSSHLDLLVTTIRDWLETH